MLEILNNGKFFIIFYNKTCSLSPSTKLSFYLALDDSMNGENGDIVVTNTANYNRLYELCT